MNTFISSNGAVELESREKFYTVDQLAEVTEETPKRIRDLQDLGIIEPAFKTGRIEFRVSAAFRVTCFRALQSVLGQKSPLPARVIKEVSAKIDQLCTREAVFGADIDNALSAAINRLIWTDEVRDTVAQRLRAVTNGAK